MRESLSQLPAVDRLLQHHLLVALEGSLSRPLLVRAIREVLDEARAEIRAGRTGPSTEGSGPPPPDELAARAASRATQLALPRQRPIVNATGVVVHTNLGRSLLSKPAADALARAARNYVTLEYDLQSGTRSSRQEVVRELLTGLTGAPDALVVNNNAAAVLIVLNTLAEGGEAVISRGELVEIGGSFRMPDVMSKSGAVMVEVGTTNRTRLADYERAMTSKTALLVKVHPSNFVVRGFVEVTGVKDLSRLARSRSIPLLYDLGSGALRDPREVDLPFEPTPQQALADGASIVTFSGDKLLGGPQAGLILGERSLIKRIAANPLMRAIRVDKLTLAALEATLIQYRDEGSEVWDSVPTLSMIRTGEDELNRRARSLARRLRTALAGKAVIEVVFGGSEAGGGTLPDHSLPSALVSVQPLDLSVTEVAGRLRRVEVPVIAIVREGNLLLDLRTVQPSQANDLIDSLSRVMP